MNVILAGRSNRGKQIIQRCGDTWKVLRETDKAIEVEPFGKPNPNDWQNGLSCWGPRWVQKVNDPKFAFVVPEVEVVYPNGAVS